MLKRLFKENTIFSKSIFLLLSLLLWFLPPFDFSPFLVSENSFAFLYFNIESKAVLVFLDVIAFGLLLFQASMIYYLTQKLKIFPVRNLLPSFMYVLLMSISHELCSFNPFLIANTFLLWALITFFNAFEGEKIYQNLFNTFFLIALAGLFFSFYWTFFATILLSFIFLGFSAWRYWIIAILGMATPILLIASFFFFLSDINIFIQQIVPQFVESFSPKNYIHSLLDIYSLVLFVVLGIITFIFVWTFKTNRTVIQIKQQSLILWFLFFCFFIWILPIQSLSSLYLISAPLLAIILSLLLIYSSKRILSELILLFLLVLIIFDRLF
jgi:hypothetical protein